MYERFLTALGRIIAVVVALSASLLAAGWPTNIMYLIITVVFFGFAIARLE